MVIAATSGRRPPPRAACRAGFWPSPAETTLPRMTSSICSGAGPEAPLLEGLNGVLIEAKAETAHNAHDIDSAVLANDCFENNSALIAGFTGFFGILRLNALQDGRRSHTPANAEHTAAYAAALARSNARSFAFPNASALAAPNTSANTRSRRRRSRDAVRISQVQQINSRHLRQRWSDHSGFDDQCGIGILWRFRIRRNKLLFGGPRQSTLRRWRRSFFATAATAAGFIVVGDGQDEIDRSVNHDDRFGRIRSFGE